MSCRWIWAFRPLSEHAAIRALNHAIDERRNKDKDDKEARQQAKQQAKQQARLNRGKWRQGLEEEDEEEEEEGIGSRSPVQWDELGGRDDFGSLDQWDELGGGDEDLSLP